MYWVRDTNGGLLNLARASRIFKVPGANGQSATVSA